MRYYTPFVYAVVSSSPPLPRLCVNCRFMTKKYFFVGDEFGKCSLFPKTIQNTEYFVTGKETVKDELWYCSTARNSEDMCGKNGNYFEPK
jgi:hypothetical protein